MSADGSIALSDHLSEARFYFAQENDSKHRWEEIGANDDRCKLVIDDLASISQKLAEVPHDEAGLNTQRIGQFFARYGLASKTFTAVDPEGQQTINEIMGFGRGQTNTVASYFPLVDFTYVLRGANETTNDIVVTEKRVVHEVSHANHPTLDIVMHHGDDGLGYRLLRNGFAHDDAHKRRGNFFEEGFAGLMENKYLTEELGLTNGLLDSTLPHELYVSPDTTYLIPGNLLRRGSEEGWVVWDASAHAAYGMQLLVAQDPDIFTSMLAARKDPNGLREFALRINALSSGMYDKLSRFDYQEMQFRRAAHFIIEKLYNGNQEDALAAAAGQDSRLLIAA